MAGYWPNPPSRIRCPQIKSSKAHALLDCISYFVLPPGGPNRYPVASLLLPRLGLSRAPYEAGTFAFFLSHCRTIAELRPSVTLVNDTLPRGQNAPTERGCLPSPTPCAMQHRHVLDCSHNRQAWVVATPSGTGYHRANARERG